MNDEDGVTGRLEELCVMEIEKKYLVRQLPENLEQYEKKVIEQGYLCSEPVVRIRRSNDKYVLTYKNKMDKKDNSEVEKMKNNGIIINQEVELDLTSESYKHLVKKVDNNLISKVRYIIPINDGLVDGGLNVELDIFKGRLEGLVFAEVEFPDEETAVGFAKPAWLGEDVSADGRYANSYLATLDSIGLLDDFLAIL